MCDRCLLSSLVGWAETRECDFGIRSRSRQEKKVGRLSAMPVGQCLGQVNAPDHLGAREIGDRASDTHDSDLAAR